MISAPATTRPSTWKWWICGLLLLASTLNYMDRQTLSNVATRISKQFHLREEQYGNIETFFGLAFAFGSLFFGWVVDRLPVRWVYPAVVCLWSGVGFLTASVGSYPELLACRTLLGFFEGGHWPCAIKTTLRLMESKDRSMGNSVLQSGTSIGAILTPQLMKLFLTDDPDSWRPAFQLVGVVGGLWLLVWLYSVRETDLREEPRKARTDPGPSFWSVVWSRRMATVVVVISLINTGWQILRAWLTKFLIQGRGYSDAEALNFNSVFFIASDVGVFAAGFLTLWLHRRGASVHRARSVTFLGCALLSTASLFVLILPKGPLLLVVLSIVAAGALGVFPIYHALTQDIAPQHQGKISGLGSFLAWLWAPAHKYYGLLVDRTGSFDLGFALAGCAPLLAWLVLVCLWGRDRDGGGERDSQLRET